MIEFVARCPKAAEDRCRFASITCCAAGLMVAVLVHESCGNKNRGNAVLEAICAAIVWCSVVIVRVRKQAYEAELR